MSDGSKEDSVSYDYNTLGDEKISSHFYDWYKKTFGKNPICLFLNLMSHDNMNDFVNFDKFNEDNSLVTGYEKYKDYFPKREYYDAIFVMSCYLKYLKDM